jgi:integrase
MPSAPLTSQFVRAAACPLGRAKIDFFDTDQKGFLLEVRCSGGKTFYQRYVDAHGRQRQFKLGPAKVLSLEQARRLARSALAEALLGAGPQTRRQEKRSIPTLNQFVGDRYLPHAKASKRSWQTDETILRIHILPSLGSLSIDMITSGHVAGLVNNMRAKGYAAGTINRALTLLRYVFNLVRKWDVPGAGVNPTAGITTTPAVQRQRFLTREETQRLVAAIKADKNRVAADAIMLLLLTGARRSEITQAKWEYVDWERRTLLVPISKSSRPRRIALNAAAIALLQSLPRTATDDYIFPSPFSGHAFASLFYPWDRIRRRAGLVEVRLHDLRHSFASFLVNQGVSLYVVQGLLGHTQPRMTQRYAHLAQETLLDAAEVVSSVIHGPPEPSSNASMNLTMVQPDPASGQSSEA